MKLIRQVRRQTTPQTRPTDPDTETTAREWELMAAKRNQRIDKDALKQWMSGRWLACLSETCGIDPSRMTGQHGPCPNPNCPDGPGKDRFRAYGDAEQTGGSICNKCDSCGDGFAYIQKHHSTDFVGALRKVNDWAISRGFSSPPGSSPSAAAVSRQPVADVPAGPAKPDVDKVAEARQQFGLQPFDKTNPLHIAAVTAFCDAKDGIKPQDVVEAGCHVGKHYDGSIVLAFPAYRTAALDSAVHAWVLYRVNGSRFPEHTNKDGKKTGERKCHIVNNRKTGDGLVIVGGRERFASALNVISCEGLTDAMSIAGLLPKEYSVTSNIMGANKEEKFWNGPSGPDPTNYAGKTVICIPDNDPSRQGLISSRLKAAAIANHAREVYVAELPAKYKDARDYVADGNRFEQLTDLFETMVQVSAPVSSDPKAVATTAGDSASATECGIDEIELSFDEHSMNEDAIAALARHDKNIFQFCGGLAQISDTFGDDGLLRQRVEKLHPRTVRERISRSVRVFQFAETEDGSQKKQYKPLPKSFDAVAFRGNYPESIRRIDRVVTSPVLLRDGSILQRAGYDPESRLFADFSDRFPEISSTPSATAVRESVRLMTGLYDDFPFSSEIGVSVTIAGALTPLAREAYLGPTGPLFLFSANVRGSGKSTLADIGSIIVTGRAAVRQILPADSEETRKVLIIAAEAKDAILLWDNIPGRFGNHVIDAILTAEVFRERRLRHSEMIESRLVTTFYATANSPIIGADTARRVCEAKLDCQDEHPEDRSNFKIADIKKHVRMNRPAYLSACLTILRGYFAAGRPDQHLRPWGSYEGWSDVVRNAVVWAGLADPGDSRTSIRETADSEAECLRQVIDAFQEADPSGEGLMASDLIKIAKGDMYGTPQYIQQQMSEALEGLCGDQLNRINSHRVGHKLRGFRRRVVDGRMIDIHPTKKKNNYWSVQSSGGHGGLGGHVNRVSRENKNIDTSHDTPPYRGSENTSATSAMSADHPPTSSSVDVDWAAGAFS
jgi:hypothetical protein